MTVVVLGALAILFLPRGGPTRLPDFRLVDQAGKEVSLATFAGKVWVANFIFTRCGETCPQMTLRFKALADVLRAAPEMSGQVRLVSFSVDPLRDAPADLAEYARAKGADLSVWSFLTGEEGAVHRLCTEGFRLPMREGSPAAPDAIHSDRFVMVDREGAVRGHYTPLSDPAEMERLQRDLRVLVLEGAHGD